MKSLGSVLLCLGIIQNISLLKVLPSLCTCPLQEQAPSLTAIRTYYLMLHDTHDDAIRICYPVGSIHERRGGRYPCPQADSNDITLNEGYVLGN